MNNNIEIQYSMLEANLFFHFLWNLSFMTEHQIKKTRKCLVSSFKFNKDLGNFNR